MHDDVISKRPKIEKIKIDVTAQHASRSNKAEPITRVSHSSRLPDLIDTEILANLLSTARTVRSESTPVDTRIQADSSEEFV